jgi:hypothetical protein
MATLVLGLLFWIFHISVHMLLGLSGALSLLVLGVVATFTPGMRPFGGRIGALAPTRLEPAALLTLLQQRV